MDDESDFRQALRKWIERRNHEVVFEADSGESVGEDVLLHRPDVVVLDVQMPVRNGLDVMRHVQQQGIAAAVPTRFLFVSVDSSYETICAGICSDIGGSGYVSKDQPFSVILSAIMSVARGRQPVLATQVHAIGFDHLSEQLTAREVEVAKLRVRGLAGPEIARLLGIGASTVRTNLAAIARKLQLRDYQYDASESEVIDEYLQYNRHYD